MSQLIHRIPDDQVIGVVLGSLGIVCGCTVIVTAIAARCWTRHRQRQTAEPLIREMLAKGMSGDEIAAVLVAAFEVGPIRRRKLLQASKPPSPRHDEMHE